MRAKAKNKVVKVFHAKNRMFTVEATEHVLVANVELPVDENTTDIKIAETAFMLTNHIDCPWWLNKGVKLIGEPTRSTSVGDYVKIGRVRYKVAPIGWVKMD